MTERSSRSHGRNMHGRKRNCLRLLEAIPSISKLHLPTFRRANVTRSSTEQKAGVASKDFSNGLRQKSISCTFEFFLPNIVATQNAPIAKASVCVRRHAM